MDPAKFRMLNLIGEGERLASGHRLERVKARETLEAALRAGRWDDPKRPFVGRGLSMSHRFAGLGESNAKVRIEADGTVNVITATPDTGTGAHTVFQQIAAELVGIPLRQVVVSPGNTDSVENDAGAGASRVTHVAGQAVYQAALAMRERIAEERKSRPGTSLAELARGAAERGRPLETEGRFNATEADTVTAFCAQVATVEVDLETGQLRLLGIVTAHDVGTVINPIGHQGQIEGGIIQGMGFALMEEMGVEDGKITTLSLGDYKLPVIKDIPPLTTVILEEPAGPGPFQAKSIGEGSISPVPAAIANAVFDACGVRITDLPLTAEKIFFALRASGGAR
jgi:CO/xanthine dehydrogenase Mo-binding subunit